MFRRPEDLPLPAKISTTQTTMLTEKTVALVARRRWTGRRRIKKTRTFYFGEGLIGSYSS